MQSFKTYFTETEGERERERERERGGGCGKEREAAAFIQSLVKLQSRFLSLLWKTCLRQNCSQGSSACSEGLALGHNTLIMMMMMFKVNKLKNPPCKVLKHTSRKHFKIKNNSKCSTLIQVYTVVRKIIKHNLLK